MRLVGSFFSDVQSSERFFKSGTMLACFMLAGKLPVENDKLINFTMTGMMYSMHSFSIDPGRGPKLQVFSGREYMSFLTSSSVVGSESSEEGSTGGCAVG